MYLNKYLQIHIKHVYILYSLFTTSNNILILYPKEILFFYFRLIINHNTPTEFQVQSFIIAFKFRIIQI